MLPDDRCYLAVLSRDRRFDGAFFIGVASTRIYCRTVCPAKTPRRENCTFFPSAAAAERAGYRPCLRCRPELAPGQAKIDAVGRLAAAAASQIEGGKLNQCSVGELAASLGTSDRHLRRALQQEFGVSPLQLAQTQRLLLAKQLLADTNLSIADIAFASGFASVRRFNALFRKHYRLNPTALRQTKPATQNKDTLCCQLAYRPPLDWQALLHFGRARAIAGVEIVTDRDYQRTVCWGESQGWLRVSQIPGQNKLRVELSIALVAVVAPVLNRVKALFDLAADPVAIAEHLGDLAAASPGLRVPGAFNSFEIAVRAILGQQISVKAASTLMGRFVRAFGIPIETPFPELTHCTPTPDRIATLSAADLTALGIMSARATSILALARALTRGELQLDCHTPVDTANANLKTLPGIGDWTAQYIAMRALAYPDAFPHGDLGLRRALAVEKPKQVAKIAEAWRPWRAYAAMHLWKSLESEHDTLPMDRKPARVAAANSK